MQKSSKNVKNAKSTMQVPHYLSRQFKQKIPQYCKNIFISSVLMFPQATSYHHLKYQISVKTSRPTIFTPVVWYRVIFQLAFFISTSMIVSILSLHECRISLNSLSNESKENSQRCVAPDKIICVMHFIQCTTRFPSYENLNSLQCSSQQQVYRYSIRRNKKI